MRIGTLSVRATPSGVGPRVGVTVAAGEAGGTPVAAGAGVDVRLAVADGAAVSDGVDRAPALGATGVPAAGAAPSAVAEGARVVVIVGSRDGVWVSAATASGAVAPAGAAPGVLSGPLQPVASNPASRSVKRMPPVPWPVEFMRL